MSLVYEKHQRDYSLLGTSLMFRAFFSNPVTKYFSYTPHPMYIMVKRGILYHFFAEKDVQQRAKNWLRDYGTVEKLRMHKKLHDKVLDSFRKLIAQKSIKDPIKSLKVLEKKFIALLPTILVAIELPEIKNRQLSKDLLDICKSIRLQNENVYKVGFDFQNSLLRMLEIDSGLPIDTLKHLTISEFDIFLSSRRLPKNLETRVKFIFVRHYKNSEKIYFDPTSPHRFNIINNSKNSLSDILQGQSAFPGIIRGKVRIIKLVKDAKLLKKGEVLVTSMTDPRYIPVMKRAGAIVTNEGGITCHASIVSRELKKPCIVGTKHATHVLRNGNLVEVNADKGIVKILTV